MELDNLKNSWNSVSVDLNSNKFDIINATKKEMESPLSALKKISKKQMLVLPLLFIFLLIMTGFVPEMKSQLLVWMAFILLPLTALYHYFNLRMIKGLEETNGSVKNDLQRKVKRLVTSNITYLTLTRVILLILMILAEILLQSNRMDLIPGLEILKFIVLPLRLLIYVGVIGVHYVVSKYTFNLYFGKYLNHLKSLLKEM
ncbi:hypothetical protein [Pedobacter nototheniae]|uniref:hypothetical protein n=1 Tax=Pedobacter nototheniae TaxID=2488994 RepID=UPI0029310327|nr:hypothetical protein [Pedobacter nototheniae]